MQLALSFQAFQMDHNILVISWHNFQASRNSTLASLKGKHDPQHEFPVHSILSCISFLSILSSLCFLFYFCNLLFHFLKQLWTKHNSVHWIIPIHWCPTPSSIQSFIQTHPQGCLLSIVIIKLYQV